MSITIKNAKVVDGTGNPYFYGDIGIKNGKINAIGNVKPSGRVINAKGLTVCPGIIDAHSHSDWTLLQNRNAESALRQGVTTEVVGNCGFSSAPLTDKNAAFIDANLKSYAPNVNVNWKGFKEYINRLNKPGMGINVVTLVGHGTLRRAILGKEDRKATDKEIKLMGGLLAESLDQGAAGFSTGLEFMPGRLADKRELSGLIKVVAGKNKIHTCHIRNRDRKFKEAVDEILDITAKTGCKLSFSHLSAKPGSKRDDWKKIMDKIDLMRKKGLNITTDMIVYRAGPGLLCNILPGWLFEGGTGEAVKRLKDPATRRKLKGQCNRYWLMVEKKQWDRLSLSGCVSHPELLGKTFKQISEKLGKPVLDCVFDILAEEGEGMPSAMMNGVLFTEEHVREMISHPLYCLASDANVSEENGLTSKFANHPSIFGWVPRVLDYYVKQVKLFSLEEAISKMTSFPAQVYELKGRGLIKEGFIADLAIFDEKKVKEEVDFAKPKKYSSSMEYVVIGGEIVLEGSKIKSKLCGKVLEK